MRTLLILLTLLLIPAAVPAQSITTSASKELSSLRRNYEESLDRLLLKSIRAGDVAAVSEVSLEIDRISSGPRQIEKGAESPAGHWRWFNDSSTYIYGSGLVVHGESRGILKWTNRSKKEIQIKWSNGYIDTIVIAPDGKTLQGTTNENVRFNAELLKE